MVRLERILAIPLYASCAWLVWVLSQQTAPAGVVAALAGLAMIGLAGWLYARSLGGGSAGRRITFATVGALALAAIGLSPVAGSLSAATRPLLAVGPETK